MGAEPRALGGSDAVSLTDVRRPGSCDPGICRVVTSIQVSAKTTYQDHHFTTESRVVDGTGCTEPACDTEAREDEAAGLVELDRLMDPHNKHTNVL